LSYRLEGFIANSSPAVYELEAVPANLAVAQIPDPTTAVADDEYVKITWKFE
jgi:hypothetical protein